MKGHFCKWILAATATILVGSCGAQPTHRQETGKPAAAAVQANNITSRFPTPAGYTRVKVAKGSYAEFLRNLPLKPANADLHYYNGSVKEQRYRGAVVDMDFGNKKNEQCADAAIFLRASYLWKTRQYAKIHFHFTNGFDARYSKWAEGYRVKNYNSWVKSAKRDYSYATFRKYLDLVFQYAGTASLSKELIPVGICWAKDIQAGDIIIKGGFPGHAETVVDVAENAAGKRIVLLAQSFMRHKKSRYFQSGYSRKMSTISSPRHGHSTPGAPMPTICGGLGTSPKRTHGAFMPVPPYYIGIINLLSGGHCAVGQRGSRRTVAHRDRCSLHTQFIPKAGIEKRL